MDHRTDIEQTPTRKLIRSIELLAEKLAKDITMMVREENDGDGNSVEVSHKLVDTYLKLIDKADKIRLFDEFMSKLEGESPQVTNERKINVQDYVLNGNNQG